MTESPVTPPDLECRDIVRDFGDTRAVDHVSFDVPPGSFFSILGPSGCGKTTLMRMIAGFQPPSAGDILIKGRSVLDVPPNRRPVNMVFQHLALFPMMSVAENIGYGLRRQGLGRSERDEKITAVLDRIGLPGTGDRRIDQLSGGQKQRIAIARCMVMEPDVLLLDEPLGALDLKLREHMKVELKALQAAFDTTFVYITHDQGEALVMSDRIAVMNAGRFEQIGTGPELYHAPATGFVAGFVGDSNRWTATVETRAGDGGTIRTAEGLTCSVASLPDAPGGQVTAFLRPESISLGDTGASGDGRNRFDATVDTVYFNGANSHLRLTVDGTAAQLDAALPQTGAFQSVRAGDRIAVSWGADKLVCFPDAGN
ncbi:ABC transporter ATP-binding protein [Oceanomicrobium pacificus]|uniref:ATP-binding cassette domain-containing protein n=1 Tax=Oceanomicrobium pacificus TaxID=2692916 RepID=A0A6B0TY96_9RHOB|nr:ABC transporter ATP-binding protein [Oceanomicrobium pacificus]MXU66675.1 ATP-binding cassette domain-containing protein [Oceanomicrobium pacificus]